MEFLNLIYVFYVKISYADCVNSSDIDVGAVRCVHRIYYEKAFKQLIYLL